jgi:hypothetical protein
VVHNLGLTGDLGHFCPSAPILVVDETTMRGNCEVRFPAEPELWPDGSSSSLSNLLPSNSDYAIICIVAWSTWLSVVKTLALAS